jgi:hypothetical protein
MAPGMKKKHLMKEELVNGGVWQSFEKIDLKLKK